MPPTNPPTATALSASPPSARPVEHLLWIDCGGALVVGVGMVALSGWLQPLYGLPPSLYYFVAAANLAYGCYSLSLAAWRRRPVRSIAILSGANAVWGCVCMVAAAVVFDRAALLGVAHLLGESAVVFWLARLEWRHRHRLGIR